MYWRLTSKKKPVSRGNIGIFLTLKNKVVEEYLFGIYDADIDKFFTNDGIELFMPYCWSYIDELPSEEELIYGRKEK